MSPTFTESVVEEATLNWFDELGYAVLHGPDIAPGEPVAERVSYGDIVLAERLRSALARINPTIPAEALEEAVRKALSAGLDSPALFENNRRFHKLLTDGVDVEYRRADGSIAGDKVWLIDFDEPGNNDWLAVNQFTVVENRNNRRPDIVIFVNGLPLGVIELKNAADENATIRGAFNQIQTYKRDIPGLFPYNEILVISDGLEARAGTLTADWERFMPWRTVEGDRIAPKGTLELEVLVKGIFSKRRFLDLIQNFIVFDAHADGSRVAKKMAGYHQFHAANRAVQSTVEAASPRGDRRVGVVWHTQGSGKSLTMAFYAGKIVRHPALANPTLVILTDRNDLDDQLFGTFVASQDLLRQTPVQAESRAHLRELLRVASGGVIFTTIQKFLPVGAKTSEVSEDFGSLSSRRNIVVIADEAHRSQYDFIDGFARHMRDALPNASFVGFTGTPIEASDRSTPAVFGDYIDIYDIQRAVEDGATVRIYYEGRLAKLELDEAERPRIDPEFEDVTEGEEATVKEQLKSKWARLEAMVGADKRVGLIARDIVEHFERRLSAMDGKGMIVCMSRRICVDLYDALIRLRPDWHHDDDDRGSLKVVMTGSASDPLDWQSHVRNKPRREALARRFKDSNGPLKLVIVRDMWLTGFDAPSLHTMYLDKPMRGHGLMQAIARVNRVFKDKPGGLVVDYLGLADTLKHALADYTEADRGQTGIPQEEAVAILLEKYEVAAAMFHLPAPPPGQHCVYAIQCEDGSLYIGQTDNLMKRWSEHVAGTAAQWTKKHKPIRVAHYETANSREEAVRLEREWKTGFGRKRLKRLLQSGGARQAGGFDYSKFFTGAPQERLALIPAAMEHILRQLDGKKRFMQVVSEMSKAFALAVPHEQALAIRDEVGFFQAVRAAFAKATPADGKTPEELDTAIRQIVSRAVASDEVVDIFAAAGLKTPDISILSDEFLAEVRGLPHRNLALELLQKLLNDEIRAQSRKNLVQSRSFAEMLERTIRQYQNRTLEAAQVIAELIELAKHMRAAHRRGENLGLTEEELAFYDALEVNDSAVRVLGDETLRTIARELVEAVRRNVTIDWAVKESARAKLRTIVKRILRKYGYPPDKQEKATLTVLEQAELIARDWAG